MYRVIFFGKNYKKIMGYALVMVVSVLIIVLVAALSENKLDEYQLEYEESMTISQKQIATLEEKIKKLEKEKSDLEKRIEAGMNFGSLSAIKENDIRRMIAFSSIAQIGYIYMGIGLGTTVGTIASIFHILAHAATKSLLFVSAIGLTDVSDGKRPFIYLTGSGYRHKIAGVGFTVGALSMVGIPIFSGFVSKLLFSEAAIYSNNKMLPTLIVLGISTILNAIYFMKTVIRIYTPTQLNGEKQFFVEDEKVQCKIITMRDEKVYAFTICLFILLNIVLGMMSQPIVDLIKTGLENFA